MLCLDWFCCNGFSCTTACFLVQERQRATSCQEGRAAGPWGVGTQVQPPATESVHPCEVARRAMLALAGASQAPSLWEDVASFENSANIECHMSGDKCWEKAATKAGYCQNYMDCPNRTPIEREHWCQISIRKVGPMERRLCKTCWLRTVDACTICARSTAWRLQRLQDEHGVTVGGGAGAGSGAQTQPGAGASSGAQTQPRAAAGTSVMALLQAITERLDDMASKIDNLCRQQAEDERRTRAETQAVREEVAALGALLQSSRTSWRQPQQDSWRQPRRDSSRQPGQDSWSSWNQPQHSQWQAQQASWSSANQSQQDSQGASQQASSNHPGQNSWSSWNQPQQDSQGQAQQASLRQPGPDSWSICNQPPPDSQGQAQQDGEWVAQ